MQLKLRGPRPSGRGTGSMPLELALLGGFSARVDDTVVALPTRKAQALLGYLALPAGRAHEREKLATLLWGETGREQAHNSLRQTLFGVRKSLPADSAGALVVT